jgi:mono/diheme cytochrome c family protein
VTRKQKIIGILIILPPALFALCFLFVLYNGPRMTVQHHIRDFQMIMPAAVPGTVPVTPAAVLPSPQQAAGLRNPLQPTAQTLAAGKVYYTYYCVFCHGDLGAGDGPVGNSYIPTPADLRSPRIVGYSDGALFRAMLSGVGHEPVLERVVPPEDRWYLVTYVRSLQHPSIPR